MLRMDAGLLYRDMGPVRGHNSVSSPFVRSTPGVIQRPTRAKTEHRLLFCCVLSRFPHGA